MAQRGPTRPTARIEEALGFVGMFGVLFLGVTVFCEVTGRPALGWALVLLVCVLGVVVLDRWRVSVLRRTAPADGIGALRDPVGTPSRTAERSGRVAVDGREHRHAGWDELAPAGRRPARSGVRGRATAPVDHVAWSADAAPLGHAPAAPRAAGPAPTGPVGDATRPTDG